MAEETIVVCMRDGEGSNYFDNDVHGPCDSCGAAIHWRPHNPPGKKYCMVCFLDQMNAEDQIEVTPETLAEVLEYSQAQDSLKTGKES